MNFPLLKRRLLVGLWAISLVVSFLPRPAGAATEFNYDTDVTYRFELDEQARVTENYTVTNNTARTYLTELRLSTPTTALSQLVVKYADGTVIPATVSSKKNKRADIELDYQEIHITFPRTTVGLGRRWQFSVSYLAEGLLDAKGSARTVYIPSIDKGDEGDDYHVTLDVPAAYGPAHSVGAESSSSGLTGLRQLYEFDKQQLVDHSLALAFGDSNVYRVNFNFPLHNRLPIPWTYTVALPPDLNNQTAYIKKLDPAPANTRLDGDGNILADYKLASGQSLTVKTEVLVSVKYHQYDLSASQKRGAIPADLLKRYTQATEYWPTDGQVAAKARKLTDPDAPVINNVKALYRYVIDHLDYNQDKIKFNIRQGAAKALANPDNAVCLEYSDLLIALLRSQGIPARMPVGYAYSGSLKQSKGVADSLHSWVEAYVPGIGWMTLDPTWGEKFDQFGQSDLEHAAFAVWGEADEEPGAVMSSGKDLNYQYEAAKVDYQSKLPKLSNQADVRLQHFALLPFIGLERIQITAPGLVATDQNQLQLGGQTLELGSLAPGEKVTLHQISVGKSWMQAKSAIYQRQQNDQVLVLGETKANPNYWPLVGLVLVVGGTIIVLRLRPRYRLKEPTDG